MIPAISSPNLPEHPLERMRVVGAMMAKQLEQQTDSPASPPAEPPPPAPAKTARAAMAELFGSRRRPAPDVVIPLSSRPAPPPAAAPEPTRAAGATITPEYLTPDESRFNRYMYATQATAQALAERFGGRVSTHQFKWATSASATPGIADILQPPEFFVLDFGNTQVNAGELARFYEPGVDPNPDARAAEYLFRAGVRNDFVNRHLPGYMRGVDTSNTTNPLTGERVVMA